MTVFLRFMEVSFGSTFKMVLVEKSTGTIECFKIRSKNNEVMIVWKLLRGTVESGMALNET